VVCVVTAGFLAAGGLSAAGPAAAVDGVSQPVPGHAVLVPEVPRNNTPRISNGEIWDIEVIPSLNRVFIAGSFTSIQNNTSTSTTTYNQPYLASYNYSTGLVDSNFRPTFNGGVSAVEATPDNTKLFVGGAFSTVNGVAKQKVASLSLSTGAPLSTFSFSNSTNNAVTALAATDTSVYIGGKFTRVNGVLMTGLAAASATTGAIDTSFDNQISGGVGVSGALTVQQLKLTHDNSKLLVLHTGRQIDGQDRMGVGMIDTATKQLLPWHSHIWEDNIARVGGVIRVYAMDVSPDDSYFVVGSGSGGDAPPISDTAIAFPVNGGDDVKPKWIARNFDSVYSIAITEVAVYIGGHFQWNESPTSCAAEPCWPGLDNVGYGTGQGLSGYGLGDAVVRRDHLGALDPANGRALQWFPTSNSFEGNKALEATPRGLFSGGDANLQGGVKTGRVAFFDFNTVPAVSSTDTAITSPIAGHVFPAGTPFSIDGTATSPQGVQSVKVQVKDTTIGRWLHTDGSWGSSYAFNATLSGTGANRTWTLPLNIPDSRVITASAWTVGVGGVKDSDTKAAKKFETFFFGDLTPATSISGPSGIQTSTSFTLTGSASDDHGIDRISYWFRDENLNYLQPDGTVAPIFNTFSGLPDVVGAASTTWRYDVALPHEGVWRASATAIDDAGQSDLRSATRDITVDSNAVAPSVAISQPVQMTPPFTVPTVVVAPGSPITFSGTATDDTSLQNVEITLRNTTTRENLGADGTWGVGITAGQHRISPVDINAASYNWSYTTPFDLSPGQYSFTVRATDEDGLTTSSSNQGRLTLSAQVPGDNPPSATLSPTGTQTAASADLTLGGTATDDKGVQNVKLTVVNTDNGRYLQPDGTLGTGYNMVTATLGTPGATSTTWSLQITLPSSGSYVVTAFAFDTSSQQSVGSSTATYRYYPGDNPPTFDADLGQPVSGAAFDQGVIVVTGRALDDIAIASVQVGIVDSLGRYMSSSGTFTSTTPSFRTAFLNSPGSLGSNFSYTTPVIPDGTYTVIVQAVDNHNQVSAQRISTGITVTHPPNNPPVARATVSCSQNVCTFDGRTSTDEDTSTLTYSWNYGTATNGSSAGTGTGPLPTKTFTTQGNYPVTLTVKDYWGVTATTTLTVPISEPAGNQPPSPVLLSSCLQLACSTSSSGSTDPNTGDVITYTWAWGDGTANSTGSSSSHTYAAQGTYTVTLTATDGWGKSASVQKALNLTMPAGNSAPNVTFTSTCSSLVCAFNSFGTSDPDGDQMRYSWNFGDGTAASTAASPTHTYAAAGTYTVVLTVTDGWNNVGTSTKSVTVT
jgi:hypothetical protein